MAIPSPGIITFAFRVAHVGTVLLASGRTRTSTALRDLLQLGVVSGISLQSRLGLVSTRLVLGLEVGLELGLGLGLV